MPLFKNGNVGCYESDDEKTKLTRNMLKQSKEPPAEQDLK